MPNFGPLELFILLLIVIVLFGAGRISSIGGEMGSAISNFRKGLKQEAETKTESDEQKIDTNA